MKRLNDITEYHLTNRNKAFYELGKRIFKFETYNTNTYDYLRITYEHYYL